MRGALAIGAAAAGVALIGYALFASKSDEDLIRERLDALELAVAVDGDTSRNLVLRAGAVSGAFKEIFTDDVTYSIPELTSGEHGRMALASLAAQSGNQFSTLTLDFGDIDVQIVENASIATAKTLATVLGTRGNGAPERDQRNVTFDFSKRDDEWLVSSVRVAPRR